MGGLWGACGVLPSSQPSETRCRSSSDGAARSAFRWSVRSARSSFAFRSSRRGGGAACGADSPSARLDLRIARSQSSRSSSTCWSRLGAFGGRSRSTRRTSVVSKSAGRLRSIVHCSPSAAPRASALISLSQIKKCTRSACKRQASRRQPRGRCGDGWWWWAIVGRGDCGGRGVVGGGGGMVRRGVYGGRGVIRGWGWG